MTEKREREKKNAMLMILLMNKFVIFLVSVKCVPCLGPIGLTRSQIQENVEFDKNSQSYEEL